MADEKTGAFIPTTQIWELSSILSGKLDESSLKRLLVHLYQNLNSIAMLLNIKDTGQYATEEFVCGQQYVLGEEPQQVVRKVVLFGALPNATDKSVAHDIPVSTAYRFTRIYGVATDTTNKIFLPLPFASPTLNKNIELYADDTNVTITTGINRVAFDYTIVVLEYILF